MDKILQRYFIKKANEEVVLPKPNYVGIFLGSEAQAELFKHATLEDKSASKCAHHITVVSPKQISKYMEFKDLLGKEFTLKVNEIIKGDAGGKGTIEAALVQSISPEVSYYNDGYKHITLSRGHDKVPPHFAGKLDLEKDDKRSVPLTLEKCRLGFFYGEGDAGRIAYTADECREFGKK
jgi:hypothetical protein